MPQRHTTVVRWRGCGIGLVVMMAATECGLAGCAVDDLNLVIQDSFRPSRARRMVKRAYAGFFTCLIDRRFLRRSCVLRALQFTVSG